MRVAQLEQQLAAAQDARDSQHACALATDELAEKLAAQCAALSAHLQVRSCLSRLGFKVNPKPLQSQGPRGCAALSGHVHVISSGFWDPWPEPL